ncbi:hypothetical protein BI347_05805 [Chromobacterium sphagni]|uniref:Lipoprotein n=2 Tax=Chromobacterium sphagni TaxID=1903179 RepID=A0A1S1X0N3_9NEIS|nr:hypothetical protein BI347_05805 [Chromobacterium sphagni]OHX19353.1 hypothetical protein BI344_09545 [Chromobacterium sphagni]
MNPAKLMPLLSCSLLLAACAATPGASALSGDDSGREEAKYITGSNIPHRSGKTEVLSDQAMQDLADRIRRGSLVTPGGKP